VLSSWRVPRLLAFFPCSAENLPPSVTSRTWVLLTRSLAVRVLTLSLCLYYPVGVCLSLVSLFLCHGLLISCTYLVGKHFLLAHSHIFNVPTYLSLSPVQLVSVPLVCSSPLHDLICPSLGALQFASVAHLSSFFACSNTFAPVCSPVCEYPCLLSFCVLICHTLCSFQFVSAPHTLTCFLSVNSSIPLHSLGGECSAFVSYVYMSKIVPPFALLRM
jgi:hypothetical protein